MLFTATQALRLGNPASKPWCVLYRGVSVSGAIYNRKTSLRRRYFAFMSAASKVSSSRGPSSFVHGASAEPRPPHALRQRGSRIVFPGAAITRQGSGRRSRPCLQRY